MAGKFIISTAKNGEYSFSLKAPNGEIILVASETYGTQADCEGGVEAVRANAAAVVEDQTREECKDNPKYEIYQNKAGEFRFRLRAKNGEIIGKSEGYKAKASAKKGIASIGKNAPNAPVIVQQPRE